MSEKLSPGPENGPESEIPESPSPKESPAPSSLEALKKLAGLAGVDRVSQTGDKGPLVASRATKEGEQREELRLYEVIFGRDSLRTALELTEHYPKLALSTVKRLAELQGTKGPGTMENQKLEEEPGRIHHEYRPKGDHRIKELKEWWGLPPDLDHILYYASVDATPLFVELVGKYYDQTKNLDFLNEEIVNKDGEKVILLDSFGGAVDWIRERMDRNPPGFVESERKNPKSTPNQVWKDSDYGYFHEKGKCANQEAPIASIEAQGYTYDALLVASRIYQQLAQDTKLSEQDQNQFKQEVVDLQKRATKLQKNVLDKFWMEDKQYFAIGLDRDPDSKEMRQLKIITSNPGYLLNSHILDGNDPEIVSKREAIVKGLFKDDMLAAAGIRTLSKKTIPREQVTKTYPGSRCGFAPGSYHNGSVWISDNGEIASGLERHGYYGLAYEIRLRNLYACNKVGKFAEFFRGDDNPEPTINQELKEEYDPIGEKMITLERPPQEIQAWTVTTVLKTKFERGKRLSKEETSLPTEAVDVPQRNLEGKILNRLRKENKLLTVKEAALSKKSE